MMADAMRKSKAELGRMGSTREGGRDSWSRWVTEDVMKKLIFEQRLEGSKRSSHVNICGKIFPGKGEAMW